MKSAQKQNIDTVKYVPGTLSNLANIRSYPKIDSVAINRIRPRNIKLHEQRVFVVMDAQLTNAAFSRVLAYYISRFYPESGHHDIDKNRVAAAIAGIIANCSDFGSIRPWQSVINAYKTAGVDISFIEVTMQNCDAIIKDDKRYRQFIELWQADLGYIFQQSSMMFIISLVLILALGKNLTPQNFNRWFINRIKTFSGALGDTFTPTIFNEQCLPILGEVVAMSSFFSSNHPVKKEIYLQILAIAKGPTCPIAIGFREIHHMFRGHELQHFILIDKYIFEENPEFLETFLLKGLRSKFGRAISKLNEYSPEDALFVKLLEDKDQCADLNRKIFEVAAIVAGAIAEYSSSSFENYYKKEDHASERIRSLVREYMDNRLDLVALATGEHDYNNMTETEKIEFRARALKNLEERRTAVDVNQELSNVIELPVGLTGGLISS